GQRERVLRTLFDSRPGVLPAAGGRALRAVDRQPPGPRRPPRGRARRHRAAAPAGRRRPLLRPLPGDAERGRRRPPAAARRALPGARAAADQPHARLLHPVVLETRSAQSAPLPSAARRRPRPGGDPRVRARDRGRHAPLGAAGLGGVRRLPPGSHDAVARRARGGAGAAGRRAPRPRRPRALQAGAGRAAREARSPRPAVTVLDVPKVVQRGWRLFNRGRYLDAQALWEEAWRSAPSDARGFLEALVQLAGGLHLRTRRGAMRGAEHLMSQALATLEDYRPAAHGLDVDALLAEF